MSANQSLLRGIPKVDYLLSVPKIRESDEFSHEAAAYAIREVVARLRDEIIHGERYELPGSSELTDMILKKIRENARPSPRRVINAAGVILHTNLGRAPLAKAAADAVYSVSVRYSTLEYNVEKGERGSRHSHVTDLLTRLTGAEDGIAVNNNAGAVLLMLSALASGKEVIVSRGELVEIGGAFRIPEVMEQSGCILKEVGTTNRTRILDYEQAIDKERTGALLKAHTSNYKILGFTEDVPLGDLAELVKKHGLPTLYDLGSGSLIPLEPYGIHGEPGIGQCLSSGVDVLCFSGDKLLGGPQAGIIIGKKEHIARIKKHPLARAVRIDKLTLAALEATLRLYLEPEKAMREIPVLRMLSTSREELLEKAERLAGMLPEFSGQIKIQDSVSQIGGGSVPTQDIPTAVLEILPANKSVMELEAQLRGCEIPIIGRISQGRLLLDVRTVEEDDFPYIAKNLRCLLASNPGGN